MPKLKIADIVFEVKVNFDRTLKLCKDYIYEGDEPAEFVAEITKKDIEYERANSCVEEGSDIYYENTALYRKLNEYLLDTKKGLMFHASAISVGGKGILFTAQSGTGKSTHSRLWRELLGDRVIMINDDKPILRFVGEKVYIYGTPWMGKHMLGTNNRAELYCVCEIKRSSENKVIKVSKSKMFFTVLNQTVRPDDEGKMQNLLFMADKLLGKTNTFEIRCNQDIKAAETAYNALIKGEFYEN